MTDSEKARRHDSFIQLLDDQLEVDLFAVEAQAKSPTWTRQMMVELKARGIVRDHLRHAGGRNPHC
jgi:hypothetical protein